MNDYINKLSCWYIEQSNYLIVSSTRVGSDILYFHKQTRVDPDHCVYSVSSLITMRFYEVKDYIEKCVADTTDVSPSTRGQAGCRPFTIS